MFDKQYRFKGKHAKYVNLLTAKFDQSGKNQLFNRDMDVLLNAPLVGYLYGRRADIDYEKNPETGQTYDENVMAEQVLAISNELHFNFELIMLLDKDYEADSDKRIQKAFGEPDTQKDDIERFNQYIRGGVEVLYEKLIENVDTPDDYLKHLYDFLEELNERENDKVSEEDVLKIARDLRRNN